MEDCEEESCLLWPALALAKQAVLLAFVPFLLVHACSALVYVRLRRRSGPASG